MNKGILATGIIAGTVIGAGVFSLPYIFSRTGVLIGGGLLLLFAYLYFVVHERYGDVIRSFSSTGGGRHQFAYLAGRIFSPFAARFASTVVVAELIFTLVAYIVLAGSFAALLGVPPGIGRIVFWLVGSAAFFLKTRALGALEILGTLGVFLIGAVIGFSGDGGHAAFLPPETPAAGALLAYFGIMIFTFSGRPAIQEVGKLYGRARIPRRVIALGMLIPLVFYLLFPLGVLRIAPNPATDTISGLPYLAPAVITLIGILGLVTLFTSYIVIGGNLFELLREDVFRSPPVAALIAILLPVGLVALGLHEFSLVIGIAGGLFLALEAIFVNRMWEKTHDSSPHSPQSAILYAIFGAALLYHLYLVAGLPFR